MTVIIFQNAPLGGTVVNRGIAGPEGLARLWRGKRTKR